MPAFLALLVVFGLAAVVAGNLLVQAAARRQAAAPLAFVDTPPVGVAPEGTALAGFGAAVGEPDRRQSPWYRRVQLRRPGSSTWLFAATFGLYVTVGAVLVLHYGSIVGDAQSRVADAWYVFFSRDPHLAAIGFVWNPLPSVLVMPLFAFKGVFPDLTHRAFAGNILSAVFMAGCVVQIRATLREFGLARASTAALVAVFALNPMIVYYGANGMTEALYMFFSVLGVRYLSRWLRTAGGIRPLVYAGAALGLGYLVRYEAAFAALAGGAVVLFASFARASGPRRARVTKGLTDLVVFAIPPAAAFLGWAIVSYVITGHFFEQLSSQYGNTSQVQLLGGVHVGMPVAQFEALQILAYAPLLPIAAALAIWSGFRRRDWQPLSLLVIAGTVLFTFVFPLTGGSIPFFRYLIPVYPLFILSLGVGLAAAPGERSSLGGFSTSALTCAVALLFGLTSTVTTGYAMRDSRLGSLEHELLHWVYTGKVANARERQLEQFVPSSDVIAHAIDRMGLPDGAIVADTFTNCVSQVLMTSSHPHQFVITSDRDFQRVLADPLTFKTHYILVPPTRGYGTLDAVNRAYPSLYRNGTGARLVKEFREPGCPHFRLYKLGQSFRH